MLRKRTRLVHQDQQMGSETNLLPGFAVQKQKTNSFFRVSGVLVGSSPMAALDCDSVRSPTSPLDFKLFSNLGSSLRFPKFSRDSQIKCWDCNKVGLSIVDSLGDDDDDEDRMFGKIIRSSNSKNILFGPQIKTKAPNSPSHSRLLPKSLPSNHPSFRPNLQREKSNVLFEIGGDLSEPDPFCKTQSFSLDSKQLGSNKQHLIANKTANFEAKGSCLAKGSDQARCGSDNKLLNGGSSALALANNGFVESLSARDIELSEDYTCVTTHGPNPKTTHIFGDCILEGHSGCGNHRAEVPVAEKGLEAPTPFPSNDFLSFCYFCEKKLGEGEDIYMYRGEKAFCSFDCRLEEIASEEGKMKSDREAPNQAHHQSKDGNQVFEMFVPV